MEKRIFTVIGATMKRSEDYGLKKVVGLLLFIIISACEPSPPMSPPSPLAALGEWLRGIPPDTISLPDSVLTELLHPPPLKNFSLPVRISFKAGERTADVSSLLRSIDILRREAAVPKPPSVDTLRRYLSYVATLRRKAAFAPLEKIAAQPKRITLGKPALPEEAVFPTSLYSVETGFPLNSPVEKVIEDPFGRVWVLSQDALLGWGGSHLEAFTTEDGLPTQSVIDGLWGAEGRLWFCGAQGVAAWDGKQFLKLPLPKEKLRVIGLTVGDMLYLRIRSTYLREAPLYGWRNDTLYCWEPTIPLGIYPIQVDSHGLWCNFHDGQTLALGLIRADTLWRLEGWNENASIQTVMWDSHGRLWLSGRKGLWRWSAGEAIRIARGSTTALTELMGGYMLFLHEARLRYANEDTLGDVQIGISNALLDYAYRRQEGEWIFCGSEGWLAVMETKRSFALPTRLLLEQKDWVFAVQGTDEGTLWIGLEKGGLLRLGPAAGEGRRLLIPEETGFLPLQDITLLQKRDSFAWLGWYAEGQRQGTPIWLREGETAHRPLFTSEHWLDVHTDKRGWLWLAHPEDIAIAAPGASRVRFRLSMKPTTPFLKDRRSWLWFGTGEGVCTWTGEHLLRWQLPSGKGFVLSLAEDKYGRLWVGTNGDGLYCYDGKNWKRWTQRQGLPANLVVQISPMDSMIWVGTSEGFACLYPDKDRLVPFKAGLGGAVGANGGIFRQAYTVLEAPALGGIFPKGSWLTASGGALVCFPPSPPLSQSPPRPYIAAVEILGQSLTRRDSTKWWDSTSSLPYALPQNLHLPYARHNLAFTLAHGGAFAREIGVEYLVFMEGVDENWAPPTTKNRVEYRRLPPGRHTLYVVARYPDSEWSAPIQYSFIIEAPWWLTPWAFVGYVGLLGGLIWVIVRWRTAVLRQRAQELAQKVQEATATIREQNIRLQEQNRQLAEQNILISRQKDEIESKNRSLLESITYARRIQNALVPPEDALKRHFSQSFVFWKPRDIVSGDIYAIYPDPAQPNSFYLLVADCTGHGVPGAFVSLMSLTLLNRVLTEYRLSEPAEILSAVSLQLINLLQPDAPGHVKDGFEGVLAQFSWEKGMLRKVLYTAARSPFWLVRGEAIFEQPADPLPVGPPEVVRHTQRSFTTHTLEVHSGDWLYFASDGFADQLGGERGRKYGYKAFRQLLLRLSTMPAEEQKTTLETELENWRGAYPQVDDILIVGLRIE